MTQITREDLTAALPDFTSPVAGDKLHGEAVVARDAWGIPHIKAEHEYDLFFAQGYATAQDRLWQMDYDRLRALGRLSEYLGASALPGDGLLRRRNLQRASMEDLELCSAKARLAIEAYTDGVNALLASGAPLPVEYRLLELHPALWEPWHCLLLYKIRNAAEGSFQAKLWLAELAAQRGAEAVAHISPGYQPGQVVTVPPGQPYNGPVLNAIEELRSVVDVTAPLRDTDGGSNGWSIAGTRTASGLPLVAGDSHRLLEVPNVYYQVHLVGADFAASGFSIPGMPLVMHFMHNEQVAWGMTHGVVDTQDLYVEQLRRDAHGQVQYLFEDVWRDATARRETLAVRGGSDEHVEVVETHHGTVIAGSVESGYGISLADPGATPTAWVDATYAAMKATNAQDFQSAMAGWTDRVNNYPYADVDGNFGYTLRGRIAVRGEENGWGPVAGWTGQHEWQGVIPPDEMPHAHNPSTGWAVTCNQRIVDQHYPYYLTHSFGPDYRAHRIIERLEAARGTPLDAAAMPAIHGDTGSVPAATVMAAMSDVKPATPVSAEALSILENWDGRMERDAPGAAIWASMARELARALVREHYGLEVNAGTEPGAAGAIDHLRRQLRPAFIAMVAAGETHLLPAGITLTAFLSEAFEKGVAALREAPGGEPQSWRWGELHRLALVHPLSRVFPEAAALLNPPVVEVGGDGDVPWASGHWPVGSFDARTGPVNRYVLDPSDWSNSTWIVPLGASGHPGSPHYCDQQQAWADVVFIPQLWHWEDVEEGATARQHFHRAG
jgi:penicillin G amidase